MNRTLRALSESADSSDIESYSLILEQVSQCLGFFASLDSNESRKQIIGILKLIAENNEVKLEDVMNVDLSGIMVTLAMFIRSFTGPSSHRTKIKYCSLCEAVCNRTDTLTIRKDSNARHEILSTALDWMVPPSVSFLFFVRVYNFISFIPRRASIGMINQ